MSTVIVKPVKPVIVTSKPVSKVVVKFPGPPGPPGPDAITSATHTQINPAQVWTCVHNLGYRPAGVRVTDDQGNIRYPSVQHLNNNTTLLTFAGPTAGVADFS